ncbi:MAG TPA: hypothetical protein VFM10_09625 [Terriglobales bacterium]|nr:hypothetical protein [Terriglobales bacterium]
MRRWTASLARAAIAGTMALVLATVNVPAQTSVVEAHVAIRHTHPSRADSNQNVVLWLEPVNADPPGPKQQRYRMVQKDKEFHPHVLAVPVGAAVEFPNRDPFFHNVFSLYKGKRFDLGLYEAGSSRVVHFDRPGVSFIFCNIHPEMNAYILVLETPYFGTSDSHGEVRIPNVLPGRYRLQFWYERAESNQLSELVRDVNISGDVFDLGTLQVPESERLIPQHNDKHGRPYDLDKPPYPE